MTTVYFEDLVNGSTVWGNEVVADKDEMLEFARRNDPWPFHTDEEAARGSPFGGLVASGGYAISLWYRSGHTAYNAPESRLAFLGGFDWHVVFSRPVRPGDRLRYKAVYVDKRLSSKAGRGIVNSMTSLVNQDGDEVLKIKVASMIATRPSN